MEIYWVSGHMSMEENVKENDTVKRAAETRGIQRLPELFASLTHIRRTITEMKWKEAKYWFRNRHESSFKI